MRTILSSPLFNPSDIFTISPCRFLLNWLTGQNVEGMTECLTYFLQNCISLLSPTHQSHCVPSPVYVLADMQIASLNTTFELVRRGLHSQVTSGWMDRILKFQLSSSIFEVLWSTDNASAISRPRRKNNRRHHGLGLIASPEIEVLPTLWWECETLPGHLEIPSP